MVLHTWNQKLEAHAHVHALVPGGGPSLNGDRRWIKSRRPHVKQCDGKYLCDSEELKSEFRDNFLAGLKRLHARGKFKLNGDWKFLQDKAAFDDWLKPLESIPWVTYIEPPPFENCPSGGINFDRFIYWPSETYPPIIQGNWTEPIGAWVYVHE